MKAKKMMGIAAASVVVFIVALVLVTSIAASVMRASLYNLYTGRLNAWVAAGGPVDKVQNEVVNNCSMLVLTEAGFYERFQLATFYRDEYDFRSDVCLQMTVNRVYKQPKLQNPEMVDLICDDKNDFHEIFPKLCKLSGLR